MKVAQQQTVKIPSKSQFLARIGEYAPSNLKKTSNGFDSTMTSTAYRTFSNPSTNKESPGLALKKDRSASAKETAKSARPTAVTKGQEKKKRAASAKAKTGPKRQKTSAASGSVNSLGSEAAVPSQNQLASGEEEEISENESNHQRKSKSVSNQKPNLPGNYEAPSYLFKGIFQNNYMIGDTIQVKDQDYDRVAYQKGYKDYEQEYKLHQEAKGQENFNDTNYLDKKLALYKLIDDENLEATQKNRKLISLTETINGSQALVNPNYMPESVPFERLPGYIPGKRTISERERAAMFIQRVMRGILTRQRIKKVKENLKKHLKGDLDADPYEIEFYDLNVPAFKKLIEFQEGPIKPTKSSAKLAEEYDPEKKLLTNTFYSLIRSPFFPEDPMDYYVLGETKDDQFAAFPKLLYEDQQRRTKDIMLERKYNYLFEKPLMKDYKTDENSVIKSFLKSNLAAITTADLKVDKFKIEYKSPVKAKTKPVLSFSAKSPRSAEPNKPKRFGQMASGTKDEIQSEISEDYGDDFEQDSAIKESIQESYDMKNSVIKESIPYSDSKNKSMINESIQESLEQSSPPMGKISKRMSNKSISEEIEVTNSRRYDRNASFKSIEEEIPGSESTSPRYKKSQLKKVKSMEDEIEEDIPAKDSYGDEGFESLDESIQESIEKFQNSRSNSKMDKLNLKEVSTPSPQKKVDQSSKPSFVSSKPALFKPKEEKKEEKIAPLSKTMPAAVQKQKPMEATTTIPVTRPLSSTMAAPKYEERAPVEYAEYDEEPRRLFARTEFATGSATKTAEVLFANFQKELEKMVYVDNLSQKVHTLESTLESIYNQKEYNILNALQNKISGAPGSSFQPHSALTPSELEGNSLVYLMKKYNTLERSMGAISNQLNFLINNFTGGAPVAGQSFPAAGAAGLKVTGKRKPRPIIPVRRAQNVRIKDEATLKPAAQQVQAVQEKENIVVKQKEQKEVIKPKEVSPVKQQQVKEAPKELSKPVSIKEDKPKPKFQFKFNEPQIKDKEDDEVAEEIITEEDVPELPVNVPVKPVNVVKTEEKPKPAAVQETKKLPDLTKPVGAAALQKSAKFGKWHESSSEEVIEDADSKRKTPEEEDFSVKEYSDTSDRPAARVLPSAVPKAEEKKKEITMPLTLPSKLQTKKPIQDESESIIDEIMDTPIEDIDEPVSNRNAKGKEAKKEKADDDDYYDDEFEELSYHSEPKEEKPAPVVQKSPKVEKRVVPEVSPIPEKSISSDVEASQDLSIISWQEIAAPAEAKKAKEAKETKAQEKKVEDVTNLVMQSILQDLSKDLFPKRNFAQIEEVKSKLKHVHIAEQQIFNVHQETPEMAQAAAEKLNQSQVKVEDVKHNKYTDNIKKELNVLTSKMSQAKKSQIIAITINHINFSDPATKFSIFDKNPVKDESISDAYNEIFLKLFRSEFRKLNNEFATTKDVEKTMMIKMDNLINKSKDILIKKIGQVHSETEESQKFGRNFNDMYETMRHKKMVGEENDFFEEEEDIKRLMEEENNKVKESVADQVMETLFEEAVQELVGLKRSRGNMRRY